jgi:hypothetical protein
MSSSPRMRASRAVSADPETGGERGARPHGQVAQRLQPGAGERHHALAVDVEGGDRQAVHRMRLAPAGHDVDVAEAGERAGGLRRAGDRGAGLDAGLLQPVQRLSRSPASPSKRCAQPVMSSTSPCGRSSATSGV